MGAGHAGVEAGLASARRGAKYYNANNKFR
ncbi:hypothetical protein ACVNP1_02270 [Staphylococcus aureus]